MDSYLFQKKCKEWMIEWYKENFNKNLNEAAKAYGLEIIYEE